MEGEVLSSPSIFDAMSFLFSPLKIREITFKNRIFVSPMCQYSSENGKATDWHLVHLGSRAVGGASLIIAEATAVCPEGRISPQDMGLWSQGHVAALKKITAFIKSQNAIPGIQIAHAGRKASTPRPWDPKHKIFVPASDGGWTPVAPSAIPFGENYPVPHALSRKEIEKLIGQWEKSASLAVQAGFQTLELHFAHGYLLHSFLSPLSNQRTDEFGGSLENRMRLAVLIATQVRKVWPKEYPLFARLSATDWVDGGWDVPSSIELAKKLKAAGVDLIDCSSGGLVPHAKIPAAAGYQVPFAQEIREKAGVMTGAVGMITEPRQAEEILSSGKADAVLMAREFLRTPYWPLSAAKVLSEDIPYPPQYLRAR